MEGKNPGGPVYPREQHTPGHRRIQATRVWPGINHEIRFEFTFIDSTPALCKSPGFPDAADLLTIHPVGAHAMQAIEPMRRRGTLPLDGLISAAQGMRAVNLRLVFFDQFLATLRDQV